MTLHFSSPQRRLPAIVAAAVTVIVAVGLVLVVAIPHLISSSGQQSLFVNPNPGLAAAAQQFDQRGDHGKAVALRKIAAQPAALWAAGQPGDIAQVRQYTREAMAVHKVGVVVAYNIPRRDPCGQHSATNDMTPTSYQQWIHQLAAAIGASDDIVIVEPDALPDMLPERGCNFSTSDAAERMQLLQYAMQTLGGLPHAQVYLDAGNPGMISDPHVMAAALIQAGIEYGSGFSINVSNFYRTSDMVVWAHQIESALSQLGARVAHQAQNPRGRVQLKAVIDTSRNGNGTAAHLDWCNPPGRALGDAPTLTPGQPGITAYLWIKDPWASDGTCRGGPLAGNPWYPYAAGLAAGNSP